MLDDTPWVLAEERILVDSLCTTIVLQGEPLANGQSYHNFDPIITYVRSVLALFTFRNSQNAQARRLPDVSTIDVVDRQVTVVPEYGVTAEPVFFPIKRARQARAIQIKVHGAEPK